MTMTEDAPLYPDFKVAWCTKAEVVNELGERRALDTEGLAVARAVSRLEDGRLIATILTMPEGRREVDPQLVRTAMDDCIAEQP